MSKQIKITCKVCGNVQRCVENSLCDQKQLCSRCINKGKDREVIA